MHRSFLKLAFWLMMGLVGSSVTVDAQIVKTSVIALLTDYGTQDAYVGQLKGAILTINPNARLLDLTHEVAPFDVEQGAYLLDQCAQDFPPGTIFVAVVDPQVGSARLPVLVKSKAGKFYIGPDNGLLSTALQREGIEKAWKLDKPKYYHRGEVSSTFHGRDIFGPVAAYLAQGERPDTVGTEIPVDSLTPLTQKLINFGGGMLTVQVLHIDRYGNVITNLRSDDPIAQKLQEGGLVRVMVGKESYSAPLIKNFDAIPKGRLALLYGNSDLLEIIKNQGSAVKDLNVQPGQTLILKP